MVTERLAGRLDFRTACALYDFHKSGAVQRVMHQFKYKGKAHIGTYIGRYMSHKLMASKHYTTIDLIVPVPLHPSKQRKRGYNQSAVFARALSEGMGVPYDDGALRRVGRSRSQTTKNRNQRNLGLQNAFRLKDPSTIRQKHVLLVDDIITTGATIEACGTVLQSHDAQVSIAAIGLAQ